MSPTYVCATVSLDRWGKFNYHPNDLSFLFGLWQLDEDEWNVPSGILATMNSLRSWNFTIKHWSILTVCELVGPKFEHMVPVFQVVKSAIATHFLFNHFWHCLPQAKQEMTSQTLIDKITLLPATPISPPSHLPPIQMPYINLKCTHGLTPANWYIVTAHYGSLLCSHSCAHHTMCAYNPNPNLTPKLRSTQLNTYNWHIYIYIYICVPTIELHPHISYRKWECVLRYLLMHTVKPLYKGHPWGPAGCPVWRGAPN